MTGAGGPGMDAAIGPGIGPAIGAPALSVAPAVIARPAGFLAAGLAAFLAAGLASPGPAHARQAEGLETARQTARQTAPESRPAPEPGIGQASAPAPPAPAPPAPDPPDVLPAKRPAGTPAMPLANSREDPPAPAPAPADPPAELPADAIIVAAGRSGAPLWTIETPAGTIILVGELREVPRSTPWYPDRLEEATREADRVILGLRPRISPGDVLRLIFRRGSFTRLPEKTVASDYLDEGQLARLAALGQAYGEDYSRRSFLMTAFDLLTRRLRFNRDTGESASDVVRRAADRADVPTSRAGTLRGDDMLDSIANADPVTQIACLEAAMTAAEAGGAIVPQRGLDWRANKIAAVMANPLEEALGRCWPWADEGVGADMRGQWISAIEAAAGAPGVSLAVAPLRVLAEEGGVLDLLEARGLEIAGPLWRAR